MSRKHRLLMLTFTVGFVGIAIGAALAFDRDAASEPPMPVRIADPPNEPTSERDEIVCPGIILGKGVDLKVMIPCGRGAAIVEATAVEVDGRYCARVTYLADADSPRRTETLCEGDVPSVGGEPVRGPSSAEKQVGAGNRSAGAVEVPNLIGMRYRPAQELLAKLGLRWGAIGTSYVGSKPPPDNVWSTADDDFVTRQTPRAGTEVERGAVIRIRTSCIMGKLPPNSVCID